MMLCKMDASLEEEAKRTENNCLMKVLSRSELARLSLKEAEHAAVCIIVLWTEAQVGL